MQEKRQEAVHRLSAGERARLELCCAVAMAPRLLVVDGLLEVLDEPGREAFWEEVDTRCARREMALILATYAPREAEMTDRVLLLHEGRVLALDTPEHLRSLATGEQVRLNSVQARLRRGGEEVLLALQRLPSVEDALRTLLRQEGML